MSKPPPDDRAIAAVVASLTPQEQSALPSRLRALVADERTAAWHAAKERRDAAIAAATTPDEIADAKTDWAAFKAAFAAEG